MLSQNTTLDGLNSEHFWSLGDPHQAAALIYDLLVVCCLSALWNSSEHRVCVIWSGLEGTFWRWALLPLSGCLLLCSYPLSCVTVIFRGSLCHYLPGLLTFPHQQYRTPSAIQKSDSIESVQYTYYITCTCIKLTCTIYVHVSLGAEGWYFICLEYRKKI